MTLEHLIISYGYLALVVGTFLEGETILVLGGIAAKLGYLRLPWVIVSAFVGTLMSDQLFFFLGRWQGQAFLLKYPHWNSRAQKVHRMLEPHRIPIIIGFRFVYTYLLLSTLLLVSIIFRITNLINGSEWVDLMKTAFMGFVASNGVEYIASTIKTKLSGVNTPVKLNRTPTDDSEEELNEA